MLKVGLTGGIGCGKTTVAQQFAKFSVPIIDADEIAHRLVVPGQVALIQIQQIFGETIINADGSLNRVLLREIVFNNAREKQKLEALLHPLIYQTIQQELQELNADYCIVCIPLLFECHLSHLVDRVLVVDCSEHTQIERVQQRDNLSIQAIQAIIDSQISRASRNIQANDIIDNSESPEKLATQIEKLHNSYQHLSTYHD